MNYKITLGNSPVRVFSANFDVCVATDRLEAVKISVRGLTRNFQNKYEILSDKGDNIYTGDNFLVRVSDENGVICVVPAHVEVAGPVVFPLADA